MGKRREPTRGVNPGSPVRLSFEEMEYHTRLAQAAQAEVYLEKARAELREAEAKAREAEARARQAETTARVSEALAQNEMRRVAGLTWPND